MNETSAVEFATNSRIHVALEVSDLEASVVFYRVLLGVEPSKTRSGYAKFEPSDPSVNLALNERPIDPGPRRGAAHYGIQVKSVDGIRGAKERFQEAAIPLREENQVTCCYAVQDKFWVTDPDGNAWEFFVVLEDAEKYSPDGSSPCC